MCACICLSRAARCGRRFVLPAVAAALLAGGAAAGRAGEARFEDCRASWTATELTIGNAAFERTWVLRDGKLKAASFRDARAGAEWLAAPKGQPSGGPLVVSAKGGNHASVEAASLMVDVTAAGRSLRLQVFPGVPGVLLWPGDDGAPAKAPAPGLPEPAQATGIETPPAAGRTGPEGEALDELALTPQHLRLDEVTLLDQTDVRNELVFEREWLLMPNEAALSLQGNVFSVENALTGAGLAFLKLAPLPHARPVRAAEDFAVTPARRTVRVPRDRYPVAVLCYSGGRAGRTAALQAFQRALRPYDPARDGMFLSNTWGDRNRDARINEAFILQEIEAGARLGVDVVQIDDGWQKGRTANSARGKGVWNGYWAADPEFWKPDPARFPNGLATVVRAARAKGMKFGLWFGPDSSHDAANWRRDADCLLAFHRGEGIDYFKIDSVKATTTGAEANLQRFFQAALEGSGGKMVFDLDVTAEIRPGYFGAPRAGPIFVENRYTDFHRYWPHQTLRSLWSLSQFVDPLRLRMEFLNHTRKTDQYPDDPLAPAKWRPDTLFATTMTANPLGWFEVSGLPADYVAAVAPLVAAWKRERARMHGGTTLPVGAAPDGTAWTGFASVTPDRNGAHVLLFRELNPKADFALEIPLLAPGARTATVLGGRGTAEFAGDRLSVRIPEPLDFVWVRLDAAGGGR